jgi:hypothetical protein
VPFPDKAVSVEGMTGETSHLTFDVPSVGSATRKPPALASHNMVDASGSILFLGHIWGRRS